MELLGRRTESAAVEQLLARAQSGRSGALVARGEAGIGKSALLEHARDIASGSGFRTAISVGVESETTATTERSSWRFVMLWPLSIHRFRFRVPGGPLLRRPPVPGAGAGCAGKRPTAVQPSPSPYFPRQ
ncbi:ATP-binding protein [Micromonospora taraxaci]|uniref:ATP-binding protein n=1 Tax=Micromonospora taraxaci TaxID=1316803 RepID=UPI0033DD59D0